MSGTCAESYQDFLPKIQNVCLLTLNHAQITRAHNASEAPAEIPTAQKWRIELRGQRPSFNLGFVHNQGRSPRLESSDQRELKVRTTQLPS